MKNPKYYILIAFILSHLNVYPQHMATLNYIKTLTLNRYLDKPTYIINKDYVVYEYNQERKIIHPDIHSFKIVNYRHRDSGIALDKNGIYIQGDFVRGDTTGFKVVGETTIVGKTNTKLIECFWKNKDKVYKNSTEIAGADALTFQQILMVGGGYFKDRNNLYFHDKKIDSSDPATVRAHSYREICYDKNNIYIKGEIAYSSDNQKLFPVNEHFVKTERSVFRSNFDDDMSHLQRVTTMDVESLRGLSRLYSIDKRHVYFDTIPLPIAPENFKTIKVFDQVNSYYISDGIHIYNGSTLITDFDPLSFGMFPNSDFYYDKNGGYQKTYLPKEHKSSYEKFPFTYSKPVNEKTMTQVHTRYFVYQHQVYNPWSEDTYSKVYLHSNVTDNQILELKSGKQFVLEEKEPVEIFGGGYFLAGSKLYFRSVEVKGVDAKSFVYIDVWYIKDKNNVFKVDYNNNAIVVPGADPLTFKIFAGNIYKDKNNIYYGKQKLIGNNSTQLLAIFKGERYWHGDEGDMTVPPESDYYLFKDNKGYWFVTNTFSNEHIIINFLGTKFDRTWNKAFANFELPPAN